MLSDSQLKESRRVASRALTGVFALIGIIGWIGILRETANSASSQFARESPAAISIARATPGTQPSDGWIWGLHNLGFDGQSRTNGRRLLQNPTHYPTSLCTKTYTPPSPSVPGEIDCNAGTNTCTTCTVQCDGADACHDTAPSPAQTRISCPHRPSSYPVDEDYCVSCKVYCVGANACKNSKILGKDCVQLTLKAIGDSAAANVVVKIPAYIDAGVDVEVFAPGPPLHPAANVASEFFSLFENIDLGPVEWSWLGPVGNPPTYAPNALAAPTNAQDFTVVRPSPTLDRILSVHMECIFPSDAPGTKSNNKMCKGGEFKVRRSKKLKFECVDRAECHENLIKVSEKYTSSAPYPTRLFVNCRTKHNILTTTFHACGSHTYQFYDPVAEPNDGDVQWWAFPNPPPQTDDAQKNNCFGGTGKRSKVFCADTPTAPSEPRCKIRNQDSPDNATVWECKDVGSATCSDIA